MIHKPCVSSSNDHDMKYLNCLYKRHTDESEHLQIHVTQICVS